MTGPGLTEQQLADIRADIELAVSGRWVGVPAGGERFAAGMRVVDQHAVPLLAHVDLLTAQLAEARALVASYGSPVLGPVPLPPVDEGYLKALARREELVRTGVTDLEWADGLALCPAGERCTSGINATFALTKRGRLGVHRSDYGRSCDGSGQHPAVVLRYVPAPEPDPAGTPA